jgi:hypothetical protein
MFDFLNKPYLFNTDLRYSLKLGLGIAIGVFLFILFFQPLKLNNTDFNSYILTIAGFAGITFLLISFVKIILPWIFRGMVMIERWNIKREIFHMLLIWILNSVAFCFYLVYVGKVPLTMYLAFKIVLICLVFPVVIMLVNEINNQKIHLQEMRQKIQELEKQPVTSVPDNKQTLELVSDSRNEKLVLEPDSLILVRSAENYVEIAYWKDQSVQRKLLRSTMRSIEDQLQSHPEMVRCHRTCIVNTGKGTKILRTPQGIKLRIPDYDEDIPVSRQYLLAVRAAIESNG